MTENIYHDYHEKLDKCADWWKTYMENLFERVRKGKVVLKYCESCHGVGSENGISYFGFKCTPEKGLFVRFEGHYYNHSSLSLRKFVVKKKTEKRVMIFNLFSFNFSYYKKTINFIDAKDTFPEEFRKLSQVWEKIYRHLEKKTESEKRRVLLEQACPANN